MLATALASLALAQSFAFQGQVQPPMNAAAPKEVSDAPARELLAMLDKGEQAPVDAAVANLFSPASAEVEPKAQTLTRLRALARQSGGVEIKDWEPQGERIFFSGVTRKGAIPVDGMVALKEGKIFAFDLHRDPRARGADAPSWPLPAAQSADEAVRAIKAEIDWRAKAERFSGAVLIAHKGRPVLDSAWGLAQRSPDLPNTPETLFGTASTTKMLTTAAVARLIDSGKLSLETPVAKAVPALAASQVAATATIRDLLGHRVSYGDIFDEKNGSLLPKHKRVTEALSMLAGREPVRAPEGEIAYSNANYLVLAAAVEAATGQVFYDFVEKEVMRPAGMRKSTYGSYSARPRGAAVGWIKDSVSDPLGLGPWSSNDAVAGGFRASPAGGVMSTAREMWGLIDGIAAGKLVKANTLSAMLQDQKKVGPVLGSALGFMWRGRENLQWFGHSGGGGNAGTSTSAFITPDREWAVVVLSNFSSPTGEMLAGQIMDALVKVPR